MNFGVTGELGYYLAEQYRKNAASGKSTGMNFAELAAAEAAGRTAGRPDASGMSADGAGTKLYMGETYQERLSKITDKNAAAAFQKAYAMKMAGSTDYISLISKMYSTGTVGATDFADAFSQYDVEYQTEKNYVFDLDENGDVRNCTVSSGGGKLVGPTKEEQEQFEAEPARKK